MGCVLGRPDSVVGSIQEVSTRNESNSNRGQVNNMSTETTSVIASNGEEVKKDEPNGLVVPKGERKRFKLDPRLSNPPKNLLGEQVAAGWPPWLAEFCGEALIGWLPRKADTFEKIEKIGSGTYSNVYKAKDLSSGEIVALKKVRPEVMDRDNLRFMAREILILRRLDHPNVIKVQGLVTSRMSNSIYLVFPYMEHDLAGLAAKPGLKFTEEQVKCYMKQLLSGLEHCHNRGVLHRDMKGSNLLIDDGGVLKIGDFGLATFYDSSRRQPMTNQVVTLWYRAPELLQGAVEYGVGVDLWSAGCILAELLAGEAVMQGLREVDQLVKIYQLCGSPTEEYWRKAKLPNIRKPSPNKPLAQRKRRVREKYPNFSPEAHSLLDILLALDPVERLTATDALMSDFFTTEPLPCEPSDLPKHPPTKEIDAKRREQEFRRRREARKAVEGDSVRRIRPRERAPRAMPAPVANAENQSNIDRMRLITQNAKSKSEKFPPPHQDGSLGFQVGSSQRFDPVELHFSSNSFTSLTNPKEPLETWSGPLPCIGGSDLTARRRNDIIDMERRIAAKAKGKRILI